MPSGFAQPAPSIQGQWPTLQQPSPQPPPAQPAPPPTRPPSVERPSEFEQYISEQVLEITEFQIEILKRLEGITFQYSAKNLPKDKIAIPVKVVKIAKRIERIDAGFIIGTPEAIVGAFKILGIKSPFAVSTDIRQFGYDLFRQPPSTFAPVEKVPVGPDYVLGPGDEIRMTVWGRIEGQWNVLVDRDGNISLPKVGILGVTGLTFKEL
ncbi:MAG: polysaccharide export protein, partial [Nitrospirae bacterium]|nr:polysaccharide export protein [Nitrospirota bacterium]